jgi:PAS domain S-box-containing protein
MPARDDIGELEQPTTGDSAMFRAAFDNAGHGIAIVALDGRFIETNEACARIVGFSPLELQQLYFQSITHPDDLETGLTHRRGLLAGEARTYELEKGYFHKSGRIVWVRVAVTLVREGRTCPLLHLPAPGHHRPQGGGERLRLREGALI